MNEPILHGFPVSLHTRAVRIALIEKGVSYHFNEISFDHLVTEEYAQLNPFQKMPTLQQENFVLYETSAILAYIDEAFNGVSLQPIDVKALAKMRKWIGISSNYLFQVGGMQLFLQRIFTPILGGTPDEEIIAKATATTAKHLDVLENELEDTYLIGNTLSLADIIAGAMVFYINMTKEGFSLVQSRPKTAAWLENLSQRASFKQTLAGLLEGKAQHSAPK